MPSPRVASLFALLAVAGLSGCGALFTGKVALDRKDEFKPSEQRVIVVAASDKPADSEINRFALMALFAKTVYRKDLAEATRTRDSCRYLDGSAAVPEVGMPRKAGSRWRRWAEAGKAHPCVSEGGLAYETYVYEVYDAASGGYLIDEAVIAFRGTENYALRGSLEDWATNVLAAAAIEPPQYLKAQQELALLIPELKKQAPKLRKLYATGHSLGGGLAQQAGYQFAEIDEVFAFDTSPVTNWTHLMSKGLVANPNPTIHRVYHWHEGLAYVRNVTSRLTTRRVGRSDYEFYFQEEKPIAAHEMGILACHFAQRIQGEEADHGYTRAFALQVIGKAYGEPYPEHPICPEGVVLKRPDAA